MKLTLKRLRISLHADLILPLVVLFLGLVGPASTGMAQSTGTFTATGNMTTARSLHTATLLHDGKVLIAGGWSPTVRGHYDPAIASAELYDPSTGTFAPTGNMTTARMYHTATLLPDGRVLIAGGQGDSSPNSPLRNAELYDPATGTFTATGEMMSAGGLNTDRPAVLLANGKVLITGGPNAELYDTATGEFVKTGAYAGTSRERVYTATLLPDGRVLIAGWAAFCGDPQLYDPRTDTFSVTGPMTECDRVYQAVTMPNGKVLFVGNIESNYIAAAEVYDPATGTFADLKKTIPRNASTATLLPDGMVLIAGGQVPGGHGDSSAELYDPATGTFGAAGNMTTGHHSHTATLLPDGTVLIAGGFSAWLQPAISRAEVYRPSVLLPSPVLFSLSGDGRGQGAILHAGTSQVVSPDNPAVAGEALEIYCTGLTDGSVIPPQVVIGGRMAEILFFGKAPGFANLNQVTIRVPSGVAPGPALPVRLIYLGRPSDEVTIGVMAQPARRIAPNAAVGTSLLIPSAVYSDEFGSSLVVLNMDAEPNNLTITASNHLGDSIGSLTIALGVGGRFRSANILQQLGAAPGSSGPILVHSNNNRLLSAISEVSSSRGAAGVFPAVNVETAWTQGFILEAIDDGSRGMPGTHRTNLGLINTSGSSATNVTMTLFNSSGQQVGNPLRWAIGIDCYTGCPEQINTIIQRLRGSAGVTEGYVRISSFQPILAWASKVENGNDDPSFQIGVGAPSSAQQEVRYDVGTRLLVPSSAYSDTFTSSLVVLNMDSQPDSVTITAYDAGGNPLGSPLTTTLPAGGQFRSSNILQQLGAAFGSFGPIKVESSDHRLLSAVSEVRSNQGFGGFFSAVNVETAWTQGFILEAVDTGARGTPMTYRTNLGLNAVSSGTTQVTIALFNDSGQQVGNSISTTVVANGLTQLDHIVERLRGSADVNGGYLRIVSSQPILAWASKVDNGTDDPSFQIAIGGASSTTAPPSQSDAAVSMVEK